MHSGKLVFAQVMDHLPLHTFQKRVARYRGQRKVKRFSCFDQYLCMAFAQLTYRESLRDIEACLRAQSHKLYHMGIRSQVSRNTLANANERRDWRIYADFAYARLFALHQAGACFVIRPRRNTRWRRLYSAPVDKTTGLRCDQIIVLDGEYSGATYPDKLRRVKFHDPETDKTLVFLTNNFTLPAATIAQLYRCRWQVELFFKWIKQHLRIKAFYGTSENAVRSQIWIAVSVYVLVAIIKKRLGLEAACTQFCRSSA